MKTIILENNETMVNGVVYKNGMLKTKKSDKLYTEDSKYRKKHLLKAVDEEYIKLISTWKPKMYNPEDVRTAEIIKTIGKNEKRKQNEKTINKTIELKKTIIWLLEK